jgi:hypothetical protein
MTMTRRIALYALIWLAGSVVGLAGVPAPLDLKIPFEPAWEGMLGVIQKRNLVLKETDRAKGRLVTEYAEYSSGPLTDSHIAKIGIRPKLSDAEWVKVEYKFDVQVQLVEAKRTVVTAGVDIRAKKRDFLGQETWVPIQSTGPLEEDLLTEFGKSLFGEKFKLSESKKGFWELQPSYVPDTGQRPRISGPERPMP